MKKNNNAQITLYAEDFDSDVWEEYCRIVGVPADSKWFTIPFDLNSVISPEPIDVDNHLYRLSNGNYIRLDSYLNNPAYEYSYEYFDGTTKKLIEDGVFSADEAETEKDIILEVLGFCNVDDPEIEWELISTDADYGKLEEMGFSGF